MAAKVVKFLKQLGKKKEGREYRRKYIIAIFLHGNKIAAVTTTETNQPKIKRTISLLDNPLVQYSWFIDDAHFAGVSRKLEGRHGGWMNGC